MIRRTVIAARGALFRYFSSYHEQRSRHWQALCEQLEQDVVAAARSEGQALDQVRAMQEVCSTQASEIARLRADLARLLTLERTLSGELFGKATQLRVARRGEKRDAEVVELHPPHRPLTLPDVPLEAECPECSAQVAEIGELCAYCIEGRLGPGR